MRFLYSHYHSWFEWVYVFKWADGHPTWHATALLNFLLSLYLQYELLPSTTRACQDSYQIQCLVRSKPVACSSNTFMCEYYTQFWVHFTCIVNINKMFMSWSSFSVYMNNNSHHLARYTVCNCVEYAAYFTTHCCYAYTCNYYRTNECAFRKSVTHYIPCYYDRPHCSNAFSLHKHPTHISLVTQCWLPQWSPLASTVGPLSVLWTPLSQCEWYWCTRDLR